MGDGRIDPIDPGFGMVVVDDIAGERTELIERDRATHPAAEDAEGSGVQSLILKGERTEDIAKGSLTLGNRSSGSEGKVMSELSPPSEYIARCV